MIIYCKRGRAVASYNTVTRCSAIDRDSDFFSDNANEILVTYNGEEDKRNNPNAAIFSACSSAEDVLTYCAETGLNCAIDDTDAARAAYDLTVILDRFETMIQPRFDLYTQLIKKYRLTPLCYRMTNTQLIKEVLRWN